MAVATCRVVATVEADSSALPPRQFVELHVETTPSGVKVAVAGCGGNTTECKQFKLMQLDVLLNTSIHHI